MITATGIGSGLDIDGLVTQIVAAERSGSDLQISRESSRINVELSAFSTFKSSLTNFQSSLSGLDTLANYSQKTAISSDVDAISITAGNTAITGTYSVEVSQLASKHSLASAAYADTDSTTLGTGTLTIRFGTTDYTTGTDSYNNFILNPESNTAVLEIDSSNNTLEGLMTAINESDIAVSASIINDGTGYRLLLTSNKTGLENSLEISVDDGDGDDTDISGISAFIFNASSTNAVQTQAATDALFSVNGLAVASAENVVSQTIPGATLGLKALTTAPVEIEISEDNQKVVNAVNSFINGYNNFRNTVNGLTSYDSEKQVAGTLQSDFTVRSIVNQVDTIMRNNIAGLNGDFTNMSELGLSSDENGNLILDAVQFNEVLTTNKENVIGIFTAIAVPSDKNVVFQSAGGNVEVGDYSVNISQLASSGIFTGTAVLPNFGSGGTLTVDADNDDFSIEIDGVESAVLKLTNAVYSTGYDLAAEFQTQINGSVALQEAGKTVQVVYDPGNNNLQIISGTEGNSSAVNILSVDTNMLADLGLDAISGTVGLDVAGSIGGQVATGAGRLLSGAEGTAIDGLNLVINGDAVGAMGTVSFTRGLANQITQYLQQLLDEDEGSIESRIESLETRKTNLEARQQELEAKWTTISDRYYRQFNALDTLMSSLQSTSSFLESQLANLPKPNSVRGN